LTKAVVKLISGKKDEEKRVEPRMVLGCAWGKADDMDEKKRKIKNRKLRKIDNQHFPCYFAIM
jgi:hypothetical protein